MDLVPSGQALPDLRYCILATSMRALLGAAPELVVSGRVALTRHSGQNVVVALRSSACVEARWLHGLSIGIGNAILR